MKVPKLKYAVGSVAQAAAEGADTLLSEARKDVVAARGPERTTPVEVEEMAEAVSKTKGSAESEAPEVKMKNIKDTTKLVNSFKFQGGNKKMDKQFIMESLSEVADTPIVESKQSIAEFITDLHRTQMDEEAKPLLANDDFEKLGAFVEGDREAKNEGGKMGDSDVDKLIMFTKQYEEEYDKAKTDKSRKTIDGRFAKVVDSFDDETRFQAMVKMNEENPEHEMFAEEDPERQGKLFGGLVSIVKSLAGGGSKGEGGGLFANVLNKGKSIIAEGQSSDGAASISALEGPDPIEPSNNRDKPAAEMAAPGTNTKIGYAEGGSLLSDDMPVDTYDNIPEGEMADVEASQLPDDEMEDEYAEFVMDESLTPDDQAYLLEALEGDEKLGDIFDKIMDTAGEFAGEGAVKGPGTGTSDSIPARLSDGEFVFTRKATDQLGTEKLQTMMDDAERAYDGGLMQKYGGGSVMSGLMDMQDPDMGVHNQMLKANAMPSVRKR